MSSTKISEDLSLATKVKQQKVIAKAPRGGKKPAFSCSGVAFATPCQLMATDLNGREGTNALILVLIPKYEITAHSISHVTNFFSIEARSEQIKIASFNATSEECIPIAPPQRSKFHAKLSSLNERFPSKVF